MVIFVYLFFSSYYLDLSFSDCFLLVLISLFYGEFSQDSSCHFSFVYLHSVSSPRQEDLLADWQSRVPQNHIWESKVYDILGASILVFTYLILYLNKDLQVCTFIDPPPPPPQAYNICLGSSFPFFSENKINQAIPYPRYTESNKMFFQQEEALSNCQILIA